MSVTDLPSLAETLDLLVPTGDGWRTVIPDHWRQGRTAYGGFSAALALHAVKTTVPDLPPLRSALVAFIGPLSGEVTVQARLLRRGRNAVFVQADVSGGAGVDLRATFVFMPVLDSAIDHVAAPAPDFLPPGPHDVTHRGIQAVAFTQNFDLFDGGDRAGAAGWLRWARLARRERLDPEVELIAVADSLPPAALKLIGGYAPVSSMTWQINLLAAPVTTDGWYLLRAETGHVRGGTSSQSMAIWNADGMPIAEQMQSVAVFA